MKRLAREYWSLNVVLSGVYTAFYIWCFDGFGFRMGYHGLGEYYDDF
jgi:hypothetical protein